MSSLAPAKLRRLAVLLLLLTAPAMRAQCPPPALEPGFVPKIALPKSPPEEPLLPEAGFLSSTHYTSQFFGFGFDLPLRVEHHLIMLPVMPERQHALLALQYELGPRHGYIMVTADDPRPGFEVNTPEENEQELRKWEQEGTAPGAPPRYPVPQSMLRSNRFYHQFRRIGRNYAAKYWTGINNYYVTVMIATNDPEFLRRAKETMAQAQFYCPQEDGTLVNAEGKPVNVEGEPYRGPAVPTFRVNAALRDEPAKKIPPGTFSDGVYRNPEIGLDDTLPEGWEMIADDVDPAPQATAMREYQFLHACSKTLLRIAPRRTEADPAAAGPMIVLHALDPNCLAMRTAASLTDKRTTDEVAASLEQLREFGEIASDELISIAGHLFMVFHGTIAIAPRGEELGQRMSQSIFVTRHNKLLLAWSLMAPTSVALDDIPTGGIAFDGSPPIALRSSMRAKK